MSDETPQRMVLEFHEAFGCVVRDVPSARVPLEERKLRKELIREEFKELKKAMAEKDIVEVADALADLIYVTYGTALHYGIDLDEVIAEVHRANMSKLGADGKPIVRTDGKVLKGPDYKDPDVRGVLLRQAGAEGLDPLRHHPMFEEPS